MRAIEILRRINDVDARILFIANTSLFKSKDELLQSYGLISVQGEFHVNCEYVFTDRQLDGYDVLLSKENVPVFGYCIE